MYDNTRGSNHSKQFAAKPEPPLRSSKLAGLPLTRLSTQLARPDCSASSLHAQGIVMMGHSTGCQDTVRYVQNNYSTDPAAAPLLGAILQAPVRRGRTEPCTPRKPYPAGHQCLPL